MSIILYKIKSVRVLSVCERVSGFIDPDVFSFGQYSVVASQTLLLLKLYIYLVNVCFSNTLL